MPTSPKQKRIYFLGAPWFERDRAPYEEAFRKRFFSDQGVGDLPMTEKGVDYIYRDVERQINKARGLLTYNALLFTAFNVVRSTHGTGTLIPWTITFGGLLPLLSCLPLLWLMWVQWARPEEYADAQHDFKSTFKTVL